MLQESYWFVNWLCVAQQQCLHFNEQHSAHLFTVSYNTSKKQKQQPAGKYAAKPIHSMIWSYLLYDPLYKQAKTMKNTVGILHYAK